MYHYCMMNKENISEHLSALLQQYETVKLAYLFGSQAQNNAGPLSDHDFAVYLDEPDSKKRSAIKLRLLGQFNKMLQSDQVDLLVLNDVKGPEMKYDIITQGQLLYCVEPFKVLIEPQILNEYFDFRQSLLRYGLTKKQV